jgi:hypothetical protein
MGLSSSVGSDENYKKKINELIEAFTKKLLIIKKGFE